MRRRIGNRGFVGEVLFALSGLLVWAAHFLAIYVVTALVCARTPQHAAEDGISLVPAMIAIATLFAVAALAAIFLLARRKLRQQSSGRRFLALMAMFGAGIGLVAVIWEALPAGLLPSC